MPATQHPSTTQQQRTSLFTTPLGRFRLAAIAEAWSWAGLLLGMFFKYIVVHNEIGVRIMGPIHGILFIAYLIAVFQAAKALRWSKGTTTLGVLASIPPFATVLFERWVLRAKRAA